MDLREYLFQPLNDAQFVAEITAAENGILAGVEFARSRSVELGLRVEMLASDGQRLHTGSRVLRVIGVAEEIARAEEELLACIGKASGVATAAFRLSQQAGDRVRVVCGAWKKVAPELRKGLRQAIAVGGAGIRLVDEPFVYLDKNYVRMFGSVTEVVRRARELNGRIVAVQIRGDTDVVSEEACQAFKAGAGVLMVDTGNIEDLHAVVGRARSDGFRKQVKIAFGGGVTSATLDEIIAAGPDVVDVGRSIIDAPLLDFRLDVLHRV